MTQPCSDPDPSVGMSGHHDRMPSSLPEQPEHNPRPRVLYKRTKPCFTRVVQVEGLAPSQPHCCLDNFAALTLPAQNLVAASLLVGSLL
jgi:hypothetical protein